MKKIIAMLLAIMMVFGLVACAADAPAPDAPVADAPVADAPVADAPVADAPAEEEPLTIVWTDGNLANENNAMCTDVAKAYAAELGLNFILLDGEGTGVAQVDHCETWIAQGADCIIMQAYDAAACQAGVEMCIEAGVPVMCAKTMLEDNTLCPFVGQNDVDAGVMEMEWIAEALGGKGTIVILEGPTGNSAAIQRQDGITQVLANYPDITVLHTQTANWNRDEGMNLMETWLQMGDQIDAVVAHNDEMALGAYDAIADAGKAGEILVIGIDAIAAAKESVANGEMDVTILQDVETIAKVAIDTAVKLAKGEEVEHFNYVAPVLLTQETVGNY